MLESYCYVDLSADYQSTNGNIHKLYCHVVVSTLLAFFRPQHFQIRRFPCRTFQSLPQFPSSVFLRRVA
jgi:hypothetical protein